MKTPSSILKQYWGYPAFRPLQEDIINNVLAGKDTMALLPTGGGKSICYQVPALARDGFCLVISPLIALMQDQVARLNELGIMAACIHAGMKYNEVKDVLDGMLTEPFKLLYVSPERLHTRLFKDYLPDLNVNLIAIDEAHCISQWGHDFRPDYLRISILRKYLPDVPMLALTASATPHVQEDICQQLQLRKPTYFRQSFERTNIFYEVRYSENKLGEIVNALKGLNATAIIYCRSRKLTEILTQQLGHEGIRALAYHAGMTKEARDAAQQSWMKDEVKVMVATTAFGMGIDKPDVRLVMHYDAPEHLEAWYQEAGRGGRDGEPARAITLYNSRDLMRLEQSTALQFPSEDYLRKVYQSVVEYLQVPIGAEPYCYYSFDLADFAQKFKLDALPASHALRLLEREGLWTMSDAVQTPATIKFTCTRNDVDVLVERYPQLGYVATALIRLYTGIFFGPTVIRLYAIAKQCRLNYEQVQYVLGKLSHMGIIDYQHPTEGPQLFFHHYRVDSRHLLLNYQRIQLLRQQHEERTRAMIRFLENKEQCRDRILLGYFGEQADKDCRHCDVCRKNYSNEATEKELIKTKIAGILKGTDEIGLSDMSAHFPNHQHVLLFATIRQMAEDGALTLKAGNRISIS